MAFLSGYNRRQKITIDSDTYISGDLSDQAVVVHIVAGNTNFWANDDGDGTYVRFTTSDGTTLLDFEVESYDDVGEDAWWHVEVATLLSATNTEIYIYYNADIPSDGSDKEGTWDANYETVHHLNEDKPEGANDDSTSNNHNLSVHGATDGLGKIDRAKSFDGIDDYIHMGDVTFLDGGSAVTYEAWFESDDASVTQVILAKQYLAGHFDIRITSNKVLYRQDNTGGFGRITGSATISDNTWYHVVCIWDGTDMVQYVNAVSDGTDTLGGVAPATSDKLAIGVNLQASEVAPVNDFKGTIDEVTISLTDRTFDWVKARYQSGLGTWMSFGSEETIGTVADPSLLLMGVG